MTWRDLVRSSLRLVPGASGRGRGLSEPEFRDAQFVLNAMLDAWGVERRKVFTITIDLYTLTANQQTYTIGPGGDLNGARPVKIEQADLVFNDSTPYVRRPLALIDDEQWSEIRVQALTNSVPLRLYYDGSYDSNGRGKIYLWPGPAIGYGLELYHWQQLSQVTNLAATVTLPPGYTDAIRYRLAVKCGEEWGRPVTDRVERLANQAMAAIESRNGQPKRLRNDLPRMSRKPYFYYRDGNLS